MTTCKHCADADESARRRCRGLLKILRTERANESHPRRRNTKLRAIKKLLARLTAPPYAEGCDWQRRT